MRSRGSTALPATQAEGRTVRRRPPAILLIAAALILVSPGVSNALQAGPHAVGFETFVAIDRSRSFPGAVVARPRPVVIATWYPAAAKSGSAMRLADYLAAEGAALASAGLNDSPTQRSDEFFSDASGRGADRPELDRLLLLPAAARRGAAWKKAAFPVLLWAHTDTLAKALPCEYLASHGFVVISTSPVGTFERDLDVGLSGAETQARDLEFALAEITARGHADVSRTAILGMSFGGISGICYALRHPDLRALVSLDGGAGSASGAATIQQSAYFEAGRLTAPLLHLYQPNGADLAFFEGLRYCRRALIRFPDLRHPDFSGSGLLEEWAPHYFGPPGEDRRASRADVWNTTLLFLQSSFSGSCAASSFTTERTPTAAARRFLDPLPRPLLLEELRGTVEKGGMAAVEESYRQRLARDPAPISEDTCRKLGSWLLETRSREDARRLFSIQLAMYPRSARANYALGMTELGIGDKPAATRHLSRSLELLAEDESLDPPTRARIDRAAREALQ